jgi:hypothetical protein
MFTLLKKVHCSEEQGIFGEEGIPHSYSNPPIMQYGQEIAI